MIPKVSRGQDFAGLVRYLFREGASDRDRTLDDGTILPADVHVNPHLVAGDPLIFAWHGRERLSVEEVAAVGRTLQQPSRAFVPVGAGRLSDANPHKSPVWHCSLSVPPKDGLLGDDKWSAIATDFMRSMGFIDESGDGPPWIAVHHGPSRNGNDHIHLAVSLVRHDGSVLDVHNDFRRAHQACRQLEARFGLSEVEGRRAGLGDRALHSFEHKRARSTHQEPTRHVLERQVRAAATMSMDEGEFVRRLRGMKLSVVPRFGDGETGVVVGYSVARHGAGERRFGGGTLARDLTLPRLRERWVDTRATRREALDEWGAAAHGRPVALRGREHSDERIVARDSMERVNRGLWLMRDAYRAWDANDLSRYSLLAQETAGLLATWSWKVEGRAGGPVADAARACRRLAATSAHAPRPKPSPRASTTGGALLIYQLAGGRGKRVQQAILVKQVLNSMKALHDAAVANRQAGIAAQIAAAARGDLAKIEASLPPVPDSVLDHEGPVLANAERALASAGPPQPHRRPTTDPQIER